LHEFLQEASKQKQENVHKWEDCARSCNQTDGCSLFTYQPESVFKSNCWLIKVSRFEQAHFCKNEFAPVDGIVWKSVCPPFDLVFLTSQLWHVVAVSVFCR
jgi:hypothetical protein